MPTKSQTKLSPPFAALAIALLCVAEVSHVGASPGRGAPLSLSRGVVQNVKNPAELQSAVAEANRTKKAVTLLLEDGTYLLGGTTLEITCPGMVLRSASGNRDAVVLRGPDDGPKASLGNVFLISANDVVIADLTLGHCRYHGIQVRGESPFDVSGLLVHNCVLVDCNEQFIKGSSSDEDPIGATDGCIEQCRFLFSSGWAYQYYTGGIDIHKGVNWVIRDNEFRNLRTPLGQPGIAEHAIHFWKRCGAKPQNVIVERNWIVNCDRGIGFGLVNAEGGFWGGRSAIRNNMVFNDGSGPHTDVGIGLEWASDVQVDNNTVVIQNYWAPMEYRFAGSSNLVFRNNLVNAPIQRRDGSPAAQMADNLERTEAGWFRDFANGDLRFLATAANLPQRPAQPIPGIVDDVDLQTRSRTLAWTIGAFELGAKSDSDLDSQPKTGILPRGLSLIPGAVNGVTLSRHGSRILVYGDPSPTPPAAEMVLLTEARRDATWLAQEAARQGARVVAPEQEAGLLSAPARFWADWREKRYHDYSQQSSRVPTIPMPVGRTVKGGDELSWKDQTIKVLDTPGYTRGGVSYWIEIEGKRVAFTGDLIRDDGKLQDLFSFQDAISEAKVGGYHGWAGRLGELMASLDRIAAVKPDLLVPARGPLISDPLGAINRLKARVRAVYANYLSIDALRWYFKDEHILAKARRVLSSQANVEWMDMAETLPLPQEIVAISNSRLLLSSDRSGLLIDCGGMGILEELRKLRTAGKLTTVEHVFVTHYHDDHTDALPALVQEFGSKIHACGSLVDVLEYPGNYRLPCLTKNPIAVTSRHHHGDAWKWKEYELTIYDFPGQTLHHNALLVHQPGGWDALFAGDSFTPSGIDDYCLQNRNILQEGHGYFRCLDQLERLPAGCLILNQHVEPAFRFTPEQLGRMRQTLRQRIPLLAELLPFDDPNYGLDEGWASLHPYWTTARAGETIRLKMLVTNHSAKNRTYRIVLREKEGLASGSIPALTLAAHTEGAGEFQVKLPTVCAPRIHILVADVAWEGGELREWVEAVVEVVP